MAPKSEESDRLPLRRRSICEALCHVLGNTCRIAATTQSFYWNINGPLALGLKPIFKEQYQEMHDALDRIALRGRALGEYVALDYSDAVLLPTLTTIASSKAVQMVSVLVEAHEASILSLNAAMDIADAYEDRATTSVLSWREEMQASHVAELRNILDE